MAWVHPSLPLGASAPVYDILVASVWLILLLLAALLVGFWVRRRLFRSQGDSAEPFTLDDLRQMRQRGDLSEEEYERARAKLLERYDVSRRQGGKSRNPPEEGRV